MKTIIAPTDFSEAAQSSVNYAAELSNLTKARLVLLHAFHPPLVNTEVPVVIPSLDEIEKASLDTLRKMEISIREKFNNSFQVECVAKCGFAADEIEKFADEKKADLIVVGMQGAGFLEEKLIGSVTTLLISKSKCPVLTVAPKVNFRNIKKIAFACDYKKIKDDKILEPLKNLTHLFKAHIYILNVLPSLTTIPGVDEAVAGVRLEHALKEINHSFCTIENEDVVDGINDFVSKQNMDLVVMIPRKHSVLKNIFSEPNTKQMAFHTNIPLMTLHE